MSEKCPVCQSRIVEYEGKLFCLRCPEKKEVQPAESQGTSVDWTKFDWDSWNGIRRRDAAEEAEDSDYDTWSIRIEHIKNWN